MREDDRRLIQPLSSRLCFTLCDSRSARSKCIKLISIAMQRRGHWVLYRTWVRDDIIHELNAKPHGQSHMTPVNITNYSLTLPMKKIGIFSDLD